MASISGFYRHLEKEWLDHAAHLVASGTHGKELDAELRQFIDPVFTSPTGARKARNMLASLWDKLPDYIPESFQAEAAELAVQSEASALPVYWGMLLAKFPFFAYVANQIGKLTKLNGQFTYAQMERRVVGQFGESDPVKRSLRYVLRTMACLGTLASDGKGTYKVEPPMAVNDASIRCWLIEAGIRAEATRSRSLNAVLSDAFWFPFHFTAQAYELNGKQRLETHQQASDVVVFVIG